MTKCPCCQNEVGCLCLVTPAKLAELRGELLKERHKNDAPNTHVAVRLTPEDWAIVLDRLNDNAYRQPWGCEARIPRKIALAAGECSE